MMSGECKEARLCLKWRCVFHAMLICRERGISPNDCRSASSVFIDASGDEDENIVIS